MKKRQPINYELKARVLKNGCVRLVKKKSLTIWMKTQASNEIETINITGCDSNGEVSSIERYENKIHELDNKLESINNELANYNDVELLESERVNKATYNRNTRLKKTIERMLKYNNCIFLTMTFRDDVLNNTSQETRRRYITRFLNEQCLYYVANIDYGFKNEREHYHAVVIAKNNEVDGVFYRLNYGSINFERINYNEFTSTKLAKYVNKLTNHAIKETCKQSRVIYSRNYIPKDDVFILTQAFGLDVVNVL